MKIEYVDRQTGELLTPKMARERFVEEYDGDDPTNVLGMAEYFDKVEREMTFLCHFVGGPRNGQYIPVGIAEVMTAERSADKSKERAAGRLVHRAELDNRPVFQGYLGPMWDGIRYEVDGKLKSDWAIPEFDQIGLEPIGILRYETQKVYDAMSN